jgi:hypothetical protein
VKGIVVLEWATKNYKRVLKVIIDKKNRSFFSFCDVDDNSNDKAITYLQG